VFSEATAYSVVAHGGQHPLTKVGELMAKRIANLLIWVAMALLLVVPYELYPPFAAYIPKLVLFVACLIILAFAVRGWLFRLTPWQILRTLSIWAYLSSASFVAGAIAWGWFAVHVLGLGKHLLGGFVVAVPALALLAAAGNLGFLTLYRDLGFSPADPRKAKKAKKAVRAEKAKLNDRTGESAG
jgi:hypothetical protein